MRGSVIALLALVALILLAPYFAPQNPYDLASLNLLDGRLPPRSPTMDGGFYWLGTDDQGRDMFSAILYGLRISLLVGLTAVVLATAIGSLVGLLAAYAGGVIDAVLMRIVDFILGFPTILVALVLLAMMGRGVDKVILALVVVQWAHYARIMRGRALQERRKGICRGGRQPGLSRLAHHAVPLAAQLHGAGHGVCHHPDRQRHRAGSHAVVPGRGRTGHRAFAGPAHRQWLPVPAVGRLLDQPVPRPGAAAYPLHQHRGRSPPRKPGPATSMKDILLDVRGLRTAFHTEAGAWPAVDGVDLVVRRGEIVGLVGESGSGKSVTGFSLLGLIDPPGEVVEGEIRFKGKDLRKLGEGRCGSCAATASP